MDYSSRKRHMMVNENPPPFFLKPTPTSTDLLSSEPWHNRTEVVISLLHRMALHQQSKRASWPTKQYPLRCWASAMFILPIFGYLSDYTAMSGRLKHLTKPFALFLQADKLSIHSLMASFISWMLVLVWLNYTGLSSLRCTLHHAVCESMRLYAYMTTSRILSSEPGSSKQCKRDLLDSLTLVCHLLIDFRWFWAYDLCVVNCSDGYFDPQISFILKRSSLVMNGVLGGIDP